MMCYLITKTNQEWDFANETKLQDVNLIFSKCKI